MAGTNAGFNPGEFRSAIRFVYDMAAPVIVEEQATFYGPSTLVYTGSVDDDEVPFDPSTTVVRMSATGIKVPCGVEYQDSEGQPVVFGTVTPSKLALTLLDEDYQLVRDATYVVIGGERYLYARTQPPSGLFDVGLYVMRFRAENEL
jgi:hypothetical protein